MKTRQTNSVKPVTWGLAITGEVGSGKTTAMCSFLPDRPTDDYYRVVIATEADRVNRLYAVPDQEDYRSMTAFNFDTFEIDEYDLVASFVKLIKLAKGKLEGWSKPDMIGIDNATLFQSTVIDQIFKGDFQKEWELIQFLKLDQALYGFYHYRNGGNKNVDSQHINTVRKQIVTTLMRIIRQNDIDIVVTALPKNQWVDFGKPNMKIAGRKIDLNDGWMPMLDAVIWTNKYVTVDENNMGWVNEWAGKNHTKGDVVVLRSPMMEIERFHPKSFPGFPAGSFTFTNWQEFWEMVSYNKKNFINNPVQTSFTPEIVQTPEDLFKAACQAVYKYVIQAKGAIGDFYRNMQADEYVSFAIGWAIEDRQPVDVFEGLTEWLVERTNRHAKEG